MNKLVGMLTALGTLAAMAMPALAAEPDINGEWQTGPGDLRYRLELCGNKGELCGTMTYSRDPDKRLQANVGKQIMDHARRVGPQSWKGDLIFAGQRLNGTMTLASDDQISFKGCAYVVVCGEFALYRVK